MQTSLSCETQLAYHGILLRHDNIIGMQSIIVILDKDRGPRIDRRFACCTARRNNKRRCCSRANGRVEFGFRGSYGSEGSRGARKRSDYIHHCSSGRRLIGRYYLRTHYDPLLIKPRLRGRGVNIPGGGAPLAIFGNWNFYLSKRATPETKTLKDPSDLEEPFVYS